MTVPRRVLSRTTYLVTRRCSQRLFFLAPSRAINEAFLYCLAFGAQRFDIRVHAFCVLSNHFHLVLTDPLAQLPAFMQWLNGTLARCLNSHYGRWENFWAPGSYSRVELVGDEDVLAKMVYTLVNPVASGLVSSGAQWPGLRSSTLTKGRSTIAAKKPGFFFRKEDGLPDEVELVVERPPVFLDLDDKRFGELLDRAVQTREETIRAKFQEKGHAFLGRKAVLRQSSSGSPVSREPRRGMNPQVASRDKWKRIETLQTLKQFVLEYREALKKFSAGIRDAIFPTGTYWMRIRYGVRCHGPP